MLFAEHRCRGTTRCGLSGISASRANACVTERDTSLHEIPEIFHCSWECACTRLKGRIWERGEGFVEFAPRARRNPRIRLSSLPRYYALNVRDGNF